MKGVWKYTDPSAASYSWKGFLKSVIAATPFVIFEWQFQFPINKKLKMGFENIDASFI